MSMNPLPPVAYTKETLGKAFAWLQTQPDSIKEIASNPDVLVSLYLKTKLNGEDALERPSIKNFKNELKTLASQMGEFEILQNGSGFPSANSQLNASHSQKNHNSHYHSNSNQPRQENIFTNPVPSMPAPSIPTYTEQPLQTPSTLDLDSKSLSIVKELTQEFNLSHESETLRLLISVGAKALKKL